MGLLEHVARMKAAIVARQHQTPLPLRNGVADRIGGYGLPHARRERNQRLSLFRLLTHQGSVEEHDRFALRSAEDRHLASHEVDELDAMGELELYCRNRQEVRHLTIAVTRHKFSSCSWPPAGAARSTSMAVGLVAGRWSGVIRALGRLHADFDIAEHRVKVYPRMVLSPTLLVGNWL